MAGVTAARAEEPSHVGIAFHGATAQVTAIFDVKSAGIGQVEASLAVLPNAVVVAGSVRDSAGTHVLALVDAAGAGRRFEALSSAAARKTRASFALVTQEQDDSALDVTVLAPRAETYTFELTFDAPTCIENDTRYVAMPSDWETLLGFAIQAPSYAGTCGGEDGVWVGTPSDDLARRTPGVERVGATGARFAAASSQAARVELSIARTLSAIPDDLHTVFVVDTSRSLTSLERSTALAVVRSYLDKAPSSSVQVIAYARRATALLPDWTTASASVATIEHGIAAITPQNGSELPEALRAASSWLTKAEGTRRVIIISDARVADRIASISSTTLASQLPSHTLVHVVALDGGELVRDDGARWADLAAATEGIATSTLGTRVDATMLVRPISVDHLEIRGAGFAALTDAKHSCTSSLVEGRSCTWWATGRGSNSVSIRGVLWNHPWTRTVALGSQRDVHVARQLRFVLDSGNPLAIAALRAARAVSSEWSLAASWGGTGGYRDLTPGLSSSGSFCNCGRAGFDGHGSGVDPPQPPPPATWLHDQLAKAVGACTRTGVTVALTVELTTTEIVDVTAKVSGAGKDTTQIEACVTEAVWTTNVTPPRLDEHQTLHLIL